MKLKVFVKNVFDDRLAKGVLRHECKINMAKLASRSICAPVIKCDRLTNGSADLHASFASFKKKVTGGHHIVADRWAGASNPHRQPRLPSPTHALFTHT